MRARPSELRIAQGRRVLSNYASSHVVSFWEAKEAVRMPPSVFHRHQFDCAFAAEKLRSMNSTAAADNYSVVRGVDATEATTQGA